MSKNDSILVISDLHIPYHHHDAFDFLRAIKKKYKPKLIISVGDEVDNHAASYHDSDPDLKSSGDELYSARKYLQQLKRIFPKMDILESNHGSLYYRKAKTFGIPSGVMKDYNELWEVDKQWKWHDDLIIKLPNKQYIYFTHGKKKNGLILSKNMGMNAVQGHYHSEFNINYWSNPNHLVWSMMVGCLLDPKSYAFVYNKLHLDRPIIGTGIIINSQPILIPMELDNNSRWTGNLK